MYFIKKGIPVCVRGTEESKVIDRIYLRLLDVCVQTASLTVAYKHFHGSHIPTPSVKHFNERHISYFSHVIPSPLPCFTVKRPSFYSK